MNPFRATLVSALCLLLATACEQEEDPLPLAPVAPVEAARAVVDAGVEVAPLARLVKRMGEVRLERGGRQEPAAEGPLWRGDALCRGGPVIHHGERPAPTGSLFTHAAEPKG